LRDVFPLQFRTAILGAFDALGLNGNHLTNGGTTISNTASFEFAGTDNENPNGSNHYECSQDGSAFSKCENQSVGLPSWGLQEYINLSPGVHTFQVRSVNQDGGVDSNPATFTWTVTPPPPKSS